MNYTYSEGMEDGLADEAYDLDARFVTEGPLARNHKHYTRGYCAARGIEVPRGEDVES